MTTHKKPVAGAIVTKVLTANRLLDGIAVWLGYDAKGTPVWVDYVEQAFATASAEGIAQLEAIAADTVKGEQFNDVALIDVDLTSAGPVPLKLRERIRAAGPTMRLDLGKQADRAA
jgi:hypothetical protein